MCVFPLRVTARVTKPRKINGSAIMPTAAAIANAVEDAVDV
jgi:CO/xanthine dehydrogenase Mo-binding subunit